MVCNYEQFVDVAINSMFKHDYVFLELKNNGDKPIWLICFTLLYHHGRSMKIFLNFRVKIQKNIVLVDVGFKKLVLF